MSKTNHRIHRDRPEREGESYTHRERRHVKYKVDLLLDVYEDEDDLENDEYFDDDDFESFSKIRKKVQR